VGVMSIYGKKWHGVGSVEWCRKIIIDKQKKRPTSF